MERLSRISPKQEKIAMKYSIKFLETDGTPLRGEVPIELLGDGQSLGCANVDGEGIAAFEVDPAQYQKLVVRVPLPNRPSTI
jgi:hypothetical protein